MHDPADESELLCHVAPVLANVVSAGCGVLVHEFADIAGFGKDIGGVPQLRDFGHDRARQLEYVFIAEEIDILAALLQLLVEVWIVVRLPTELSDIEIWRVFQGGGRGLPVPVASSGSR